MESRPLDPLHKVALQNVDVLTEALVKSIIQRVNDTAPCPEGDGWKLDPVKGCWTRETTD